MEVKRRTLTKQKRSREAIDLALKMWAALTPTSHAGPYTRTIICRNSQGQRVKVTCVYQMEEGF